MSPRRLLSAPTLAFLASIAASAAFAAGACGDSVPSDQGSGGKTTTATTSASTTSKTTSTSTSPGTGGAGTGGMGSGGVPDCYSPPLTNYVEIINACTTAQKIDVMPVLPLLQPDGGLPPLP
jgi:hypothetical protein